MNKTITTAEKMNRFLQLTCLMMVFSLFAVAQIVPVKPSRGFNYQAIARNSNGDPIPNKVLTIEITIHKTTAGGPTVYQETQVDSTNNFGLFTIVIGQGTNTGAGFAKTLNQINWSDDYYYAQIGVDFGLGQVNMGSVQLQAVPYAFSADTALAAPHFPLGQLTDADLSTLSTNGYLKWNGTKWVGSNELATQINQLSLAINADSNSLGNAFGAYLRNDGSTDLTGDWTITKNNLTLSAGTLTANSINSYTNLTVGGTLNVTGAATLTVNTYPVDYGQSGQVLTTNGKGQLAWNSLNSSQWSYNGSNIYFDTANVGIGTRNPQYLLQLAKAGSNTGTQMLDLTSDDNLQTALAIDNTGAGGHSYSLTSTGQSNNQASAGSFGIFDNTSSAYRLQISAQGDFNLNGGTATISQAGNGYFAGNLTANGNLAINNSVFTVNANSGNVGIGTQAPTAMLSFGPSANAQQLLLYENAVPGNEHRYGMGIQPYEMRQFVPNVSYITFGSVNTSDGITYNEYMRMNGTNGYFGIGTSNPSYRLHVAKAGDNSGYQIADFTSDDTWQTAYNLDNTSTGGHSWNIASTGQGNSHYAAGSFGLIDNTAGAYRLQISPTGDFVLNEGMASISATGNGYFSGTLSASQTITANSNIVANGDINAGSGSSFYFGDPNTDGSWRITLNGNNLSFDHRENGTWVSKSMVTP